MTNTERLTLRALTALLSKYCTGDDELIAEILGALAASQPTRRGRHAMSPEERQTVSIRMKKYWADRREAEAKASAPVPDPNQIPMFSGETPC
jgi:hypothetical protein